MRRFFLVALVACGGGGANADGGLDATNTSDVNAGDGGVVDVGDSVLERNNHINRDGLYTQPTFTTAAIATMKLDTGFDGTISGNVYAQVLFFDKGPNGKSIVIAVTENNQVSALDADLGTVVWQKTIGNTAGKSGAGCGNIAPLGITGRISLLPCASGS